MPDKNRERYYLEALRAALPDLPAGEPLEAEPPDFILQGSGGTLGIVRDEDGVARCWWGASTPDYRAYHDTEWGFPVADDVALFEKLSLEGFQSGLSWLTLCHGALQ